MGGDLVCGLWAKLALRWRCVSPVEAVAVAVVAVATAVEVVEVEVEVDVDAIGSWSFFLLLWR
jgi:hypothetical protein